MVSTDKAPISLSIQLIPKVTNGLRVFMTWNNPKVQLGLAVTYHTDKYECTSGLLTGPCNNMSFKNGG